MTPPEAKPKPEEWCPHGATEGVCPKCSSATSPPGDALQWPEAKPTALTPDEQKWFRDNEEWLGKEEHQLVALIRRLDAEICEARETYVRNLGTKTQLRIDLAEANARIAEAVEELRHRQIFGMDSALCVKLADRLEGVGGEKCAAK